MAAHGSKSDAVIAGMVKAVKEKRDAMEKAYKADAKRYGKKEAHALTDAQLRQIVREVWDETSTEALIQAAVSDVEAAAGL